MSREFNNILELIINYKLIYSDEDIIEQSDISLIAKTKLIKTSTLLMTNLLSR